ncbi:MAG TPA: toxin TcdB middle/N-terminal domain-containing protein, partial [Methylomirabilota bacterium]|nr:toxin TcdB middle/N-terminal domain-containing protein [Methylomirabilota bacterium]
MRTDRVCRQIVAFTSDLDGAAARVVDFGGVPHDAAAHDGEPDDRYLRHGFYLASDSRGPALTLDFPLPLSGARLRLDTPGGGGRWRVEETPVTGGTAAREEVTAAAAHEVVLGADVRRVTLTALAGPLVLREVEIPAARRPEVYAGYRLRYRPTVVEAAAVDRADVPPPVKQLASVERFGYDDTGAEQALPPVTFGYRPLSLAGLFPRTLRGTPAEPLGPTTTLLGFFGTGRPDLLQTAGGHRVFLNRGRLGTDVVVEGRELAASPSATLADGDVFLRDVEGRGAVDLTTTAYYYRNPAGGGTPSRTNPAWGPAVNFDATRRHPALAPAQLAVARAIDLDGDGRIDLVTTEEDLWEWDNEGGGAWSPGRRVARRASFGERAFPDVAFDDARIFIADMNGDGLDEIVRVSARKVEYWSRTRDGWRTLKSTMAGSPRLAEFDPARAVLADLTGNGAADLLYVHGNGVEIFLNCGGHRFAAPLRVDFGDVGVTRGTPMPTAADALLVVDLLGEGARGLLWSFRRADTEPNYFFLPLAAARQPYLLGWVENGTGGRVEIDYTTSSALSAADEAGGAPWRDEPPYPVTVMAEVREIDRLTGARVVRSFRYRDGYFDRADRQFRGFARVEERILGSAARRGLRVVHEFADGKPAADTALDRARARASAGLERRTRHYDLATGALLQDAIRHHEVEPVRDWQPAAGGAWTPRAPLTTQPDGEPIVFAYERRRLDAVVEGTPAPRYALRERTHTVAGPTEPVLEEFGRLLAETRYGEVVTTGTGPVLAVFDVDGASVAVRAADPARQRRTEYHYATHRADHVVRRPAREVVWGGAAFDTLLAERRTYYDGGTGRDDHLPLGAVRQGNAQREEAFWAHVAEVEALFGAAVVARLGADEATGLGFFARDTSAAGQPALFSVERRRRFAQAAGRIAFGTVLQEWDARGAARTRQLDAAAWYLRGEQNALGHAVAYERVAYRAGKPARIRRENGSRTVVRYDAFGREVEVTEAAAAGVPPARVTVYRSGAFVTAGRPTSVTLTRLIDRAEAPRRHVTEVRHLDGWGR